jgi:hypothetical protein
MMHATADELELYVAARLPGDRAQWLEVHCEHCAECSRALSGEASLELALVSMSGERRCGMRADEDVVVAPDHEPARPRPLFYALAAAAVIALAFVAARLPSVTVTQPATQQLFADAGDLVKADVGSPAWAAGETSGGTP